MKFSFDNPLVMKILSVIVAIGMFLFVSSENNQMDPDAPSSTHSVTEVLTNMTVTTDVDNEEYYVSGVPESVSIRLDGPQPIIAQTVITQNFTIKTPNLNRLGPGEHLVELEVEGLSSEINYNISPSEARIQIQERETKDFDVSVDFQEEDFIAEGYEVTNIDQSHDYVTISGAKNTIDEIDEVKALVQPESGDITSDVTLPGNVVVLNEAGEPLNVSIDPTQIEVSIQVDSQEVELPIELVETGQMSSDYEYELELAEDQADTITVKGDYDKVSELDEFQVPVDLSGVTKSTSRQVPIILPDGIYEADLDQVTVQVTVRDQDEEENGGDEG